nr:HepT-like ribonuclease domain-containing protein [Pedobacter petrophilus]
MDERIIKWLFDIKIAITEIEGYFLEYPKDFFKYRKNVMLKRAVERDLEIIGEAMNRILTRDVEF